MSFKTHCLAAVAALALMCGTAQAQTLRYANQGELKSLDPYTVNETTTNAHVPAATGVSGRWPNCQKTGAETSASAVPSAIHFATRPDLSPADETGS